MSAWEKQSFSDGIGPSNYCRKMVKARPMREEMNGNVVFISRQSQHFKFDVVICKVLCPICTLTWRASNYVTRQRKCINTIENTDLEF